MCKRNIKRYYKLMGCITLIITLAIIVGLIVRVVDQFNEGAKAWPIIASFLNMLAALVMGSAFANLFYSTAMCECHCNKDTNCHKE